MKKQRSLDIRRELSAILADHSSQNIFPDQSRSSLMNILEHYSAEKEMLENTNRALLNILEDYEKEKQMQSETQTAVMNILEDYTIEKRKVERANSHLNALNKELEQIMYVASYDLNEPVITISSYIQLLKQKLLPEANEEVGRYIEVIQHTISKLQSLLKNLLLFYQIGVDVSFTNVDTNNILGQALVEFNDKIQSSRAKIVTSRLPVLNANEQGLRLLFSNLISNALKFQKKDTAPEISISSEEKDSEYVFAIKDNGIGIEPARIPKLFTLFQRLHSDAEYPGSGVGLALCKKIVAEHRGKIWVESKLGEGSTFYFTLPKNLAAEE